MTFLNSGFDIQNLSNLPQKLADSQKDPLYHPDCTDTSFVRYVSNKVNRAGKPYPSVIDPRTNNPIPFPSGDLVKVPKSDKVPWGSKERRDYIKEWKSSGYDIPPGGWQPYDIHHVKPKEYGGTNDFENLVPVLRQVHIDEFNAFWRDW